MEPILDVFSSDAFSFVTLTDSINKLPFVPGRLGALGLFTEAPVPTTSIALEEQAGILTLVNPTPRGGPGETRPKPLRRARVLKVPHYQLDDNVLAEEVQNVREFGPQMQPRSVETYLSSRMEMFTAQLDATTEFSGSAPLRRRLCRFPIPPVEAGGGVFKQGDKRILAANATARPAAISIA
ncbi:MAG: major capsid protein [Rhodoplanes sp.]